MASLGLITGVLGFDATGTALMLTIFALQDSFGTACNVTGDGALYLDGGFICSGWNLLRKQSVESCKALWSGIHYCSGNDVLCCNACSGFKMCQKVRAGTEG